MLPVAHPDFSCVQPTLTYHFRLVTGDANEMDLDEDGLLVFVLDLIQTIPSLKFLQQSKDFHEPYAKTVIQRLGKKVTRPIKDKKNYYYF